MSTVNTYVATETLFLGLARAANAGDRIQSTEEDLVARGWADKVTKVAGGDLAGEREPSARAILEDVGDDKEKAAAALELENEKPEDQRRKGLVAALEKIIAAEA